MPRWPVTTGGIALVFVGAQLLAAGAFRVQQPGAAQAPSAIAAVERSLPLVQAASVDFVKASGCVSCHHNTLTVLTLAMARGRNIRVDEDLAFEQQELITEYVARWGSPPPVDAPRDAATLANILLGLSIDGYASDAATDAMAQLLAKQQGDDGAWRVPARRFVGDGEDVALTATSIRALQVYAPEMERGAYDEIIERASAWLAAATPGSTEGRAFRLLGLGWAHAAAERLREAAADLAGTQSSDGGWSQLPDTPSDPYATGQALLALLESETVQAGDPVVGRGRAFLLRTQRVDGSWFLKARPPLPPHVDTGYPIGRDEVSSMAATNWATAALARGAP
jgi:hypothetical protein